MIQQSVHVSPTNKGILLNTFIKPENQYSSKLNSLINSEELELNEESLSENYTFDFSSVATSEKVDFSLMFA